MGEGTCPNCGCDAIDYEEGTFNAVAGEVTARATCTYCKTTWVAVSGCAEPREVRVPSGIVPPPRSVKVPLTLQDGDCLVGGDDWLIAVFPDYHTDQDLDAIREGICKPVNLFPELLVALEDLLKCGGDRPVTEAFRAGAYARAEALLKKAQEKLTGGAADAGARSGG